MKKIILTLLFTTASLVYLTTYGMEKIPLENFKNQIRNRYIGLTTKFIEQETHKLLESAIQALGTDTKGITFKTKPIDKDTTMIIIKTPGTSTKKDLQKITFIFKDPLEITFVYNKKTNTSSIIVEKHVRVFAQKTVIPIVMFEYPPQKSDKNYNKIQELFSKITKIPYIAKIIRPYSRPYLQESQALEERVEFTREAPQARTETSEKAIIMPGEWQKSGKKIIVYPKIFEK